MTERVIRLCELSKKEDLYAPNVKIEYNARDLSLPTEAKNAKRIVEYILAQPVYITDDNRYTGMLRFKHHDLGGVPADVFHRDGHMHFLAAFETYLYPHYKE